MAMPSRTTGRKTAMGRVIDLGSAKPDDPIYGGGPQVSFRPRLTPSTSGTATSTGGASGDVKTSSSAKLPPAPNREDFKRLAEYEEARGRWQETVGRIKGMAEC